MEMYLLTLVLSTLYFKFHFNSVNKVKINLVVEFTEFIWIQK